MDLRLPAAAATSAERTAVDSVLAPAGDPGLDPGRAVRGGHAARERRAQLLPVLHALQDRVGWISPGGLAHACARLTVPPAEAYGVASFYALLATTPQPATLVHVCDDVVCRLHGAERTCAVLTERFGPAHAHGADGSGEPAPPPPATGWVRSPCLGQCEQGSAALVQRAGDGTGPRASQLAPATAEAILAVLGERPHPVAGRRPPVPQAGADGLRLLRRVGRADPGSLDAYRARGGTVALRRALGLGPQGVIRELRQARLVGRGGAAFPTWAKWDQVARNPVQPHLVVANADESEPGTFKDRVLMEEDPFALLEAMIIMGFACGASRGYLYLRGEYPLAEARLGEAVAAAHRRGLLGSSVMGSAVGFDIELRRGAGAYIAGEETALFRSVEGGRPEPRNKPPFPADSGLFGRPTAVNNVETLVNVLEVLTLGADAFAGLGTEESSGTRLLCVSGQVQRPGVYEVAFGATLRSVVAMAGGVAAGRALRAVLLGGVAGSFVGPDALDLPLTLEDARRAGVTLGSGVVLVLDDTADVLDCVRRIARFFRDESCGQCVPCRVGTVRQEEVLARLAAGRPLGGAADERARLDDLAQAMRDASICGLGQTAAAAVQSAVRLGLVTWPAA